MAHTYEGSGTGFLGDIKDNLAEIKVREILSEPDPNLEV